jgi:hypothetical protein
MTGADELVDLHPNVTVVSGLDDRARRLLVDAVAGLARGETPGVPGLLEAHGVLFDLSPEVLALLEVAAADVQPVVSVAHLPEGRFDPAARERVAAQRAVAVLEERVAAMADECTRADEARAAAADAVDWARRSAEPGEADAAGQIEAVDALASEVDLAIEQRRRLEEELAAATSGLEAATARRAEVEAATAGVRSRRHELAIRCADLATQLDQARLARDPEAAEAAEAAAAQLAAVEAELAAGRDAGRAVAAEGAPSPEPTPDRLARLQRQIEEVEPRLAAFGPAEVDVVAEALEAVRVVVAEGPVPVPEAVALADQLDELEVDLVATAGVGATTGGLAEARARVDAAQRALIEAEQSVRTRVLDRATVDRLEDTHARLLEAIDKAEGRLGGGKARRLVDSLRVTENGVLVELGFSSYSDYMMGYSLVQADPQKEAALDNARADLARAEDAWQALEADTAAELARAERLERRRRLMDKAGVLVGHPVPAGAMVEELRALRAPKEAAPELVEDLRLALDKVGVAVQGHDLGQEDLVMLAELWLAEASEAAPREEGLRAELEALVAERADAIAALEADPEEESAGEARGSERLTAAVEQVTAAEERRRAHDEAEGIVTALTRELAAAAEHERTAADAAAEAEATMADAAAHEAEQRAELDRLEAALVAAQRAEAEGNEALRASRDHERPVSPGEQTTALADAEAALAVEQARVAQLTDGLQALQEECATARASLAALEPVDATEDPADGGEALSVAEEIEWYLLARMAAQRAVSVAGSLPLLLDGALAGLGEDDLAHLLGRLERMADAVQVIVISDDPLAAQWAVATGPERAAVVHPEASVPSGATA